MPRAFPLGMAGLVAAGSAIHDSHAQPAAALPPVEVVGRYDVGGLWDAASQGNVTRDAIANRPLLRPAEALEAVPGMVVTQHSGDGKANQYFLRGFNLDHGTDFATWVAGMPVNMPTHAHGQGYTDLNFLIPELVSGIRYGKGPYFAEEGDFASAGFARIGYVDRLPATLATVTAGSGSFRRTLLAGSPALGDGNLLYALEYQTADGPWDVPSNFGKYNGVLRYSRSGAGWGFNVTGMAYKADWTATDQIPRRAVDAGVIGRFGSLDPTDGGSTRRYSLSGEWRRNGEGHTDTATVYAIRSRFNLFSNFTYALDDPVNGDQFEQAERRDTYGGDAARTWQTVWAGREMANTLGVQVRRDRLDPVSLYTSVARQRLATTREDRVTQSSFAPYASSTVAWTRWLRSVAGVRADHYRFAVDADIPDNGGSRSDSVVSPKLTLVFGPWAHTEYFLNWGRGFHSNDARGTTISLDPRSRQPAERVAPLVRTEGYEAGARTQLGRTLLASVALWRLDQDSELLFVGDAGTTVPSRPSQRTGVELLGQFLPLRWLAFDTTLAFTRARFSGADPAGDYIPGAPDRVASAGVTVTGLSGWSGSMRWRYFGRRPLVEDGSVQSSSTSLVNARLGYEVRRSVRVFIDVFNLFDRKADDIAYFYTSQLRGEPAPVDDVHFHPVEPRGVRVSVSASF
jgi:hypothetical protein